MAFLQLSIWDWLIILVVLIAGLYVYGTWTYDYFEKKKMPYIKGMYPFLGNLSPCITGKHSVFDCMMDSYKAFPEEKYIGFFNFRDPVIMLRDPELIKQIGVKDFDHFIDHRSIVNDQVDPIFANNLFSLKGQKWRDMRSTLSPAFTGSKMRAMFVLINECAEKMVSHLKTESKKGPLEYDMKDMFTRYANDVIATAAFGLNCDSFKDRENTFYKMGKMVSNFSGLRQSIKLLCLIVFPKLMMALKITLFRKEVSKYFRKLVHETINVRERDGIIRPDMINLLMQARKGVLKYEAETAAQDAGFATVEESAVGKTSNKREWSDDDLTAQAVIFFLAGFDTVSTLLCFAAHELAVNPDVQRILQEEIDSANDQKPLTYASLQNLKYLDMVVSETLRKWPALPFIDRVCEKPYTLTDNDGNSYTIEKGNPIFFAARGIHMDPLYYPDPERFDPERFSEENKKSINPSTYLPFGIGPRNCIGSRFALMEMKAVLFYILSEFSFEVCKKTDVSLALAKNTFQMTKEGGFWLELKPRK